MQPKVRAWLSHLEQLRGFYKHRWGDAPVHTFTLGMFLPETQMLEFGFKYEHQGMWAKQAYSTSWPHYHTEPAAPASNTSTELAGPNQP
uniref:Uncharacterized protein n=1 Tax=Tetradesmus obliquus TaxID=3088 RepID=A0A383VIV1_TETOB|eukprot:jgi/Sobl393_1/1417/SZX64840.1